MLSSTVNFFLNREYGHCQFKIKINGKKVNCFVSFSFHFLLQQSNGSTMASSLDYRLIIMILRVALDQMIYKSKTKTHQ